MRKDPVHASAQASRGRCKPGAMGNRAALCVAPGEESGVALVTGERGRGRMMPASTGVVPRIASVRPRGGRRFFIETGLESITFLFMKRRIPKGER